MITLNRAPASIRPAAELGTAAFNRSPIDAAAASGSAQTDVVDNRAGGA